MTLGKRIKIFSLISNNEFELCLQIFKYFAIVHQRWHLKFDFQSLMVNLILDSSLDRIKVFVRYGFGGGVRNDVERKLK